MAAQIVGRIQPPPVSPLAEVTAPLPATEQSPSAAVASGEPQPVAQPG